MENAFNEVNDWALTLSNVQIPCPSVPGVAFTKHVCLVSSHDPMQQSVDSA